MKRRPEWLGAILLLLVLTGCGQAEPEKPAQPMELTALTTSDLQLILQELDPADAFLCCFEEARETYRADGAIRAASYLEELQQLTWESYEAPEDWDRNQEIQCILATPEATITAYQGSADNIWPVQVTTEAGEGLFTLPMLTDEASQQVLQTGWMAFEPLMQWYWEASTAVRYGGAGTPLTEEELDALIRATASEDNHCEEALGGTGTGASAISCFFTSYYDDPRDLDLGKFLSYCPSPEGPEVEEAEFRLLQTRLDWRGGADGHLLSLRELPVPCSRLPRSYVDQILTAYADITTEDLRSDWRAYCYFPETDAFYTFTSDFAPGQFQPAYGEHVGSQILLWSAPANHEAAELLTLRTQGEQWYLESFREA